MFASNDEENGFSQFTVLKTHTNTHTHTVCLSPSLSLGLSLILSPTVVLTLPGGKTDAFACAEGLRQLKPKQQ